jgi:hypothetical protein
MLEQLITDAETDAQKQSIAAELRFKEKQNLDEQAPCVWTNLRETLKNQSERYPKYFEFLVTPHTEVMIRGTNRRDLKVKFLRESNVAVFSCSGQRGCLTFLLDKQNLTEICDQDGHPFASVDAAAEELLGLIIKNPA